MIFHIIYKEYLYILFNIFIVMNLKIVKTLNSKGKNTGSKCKNVKLSGTDLVCMQIQ